MLLRGYCAMVRLVIYWQGSEYNLRSIFLRMTLFCDKLLIVAVYSSVTASGVRKFDFVNKHAVDVGKSYITLQTAGKGYVFTCSSERRTVGRVKGAGSGGGGF